ncbi:MAG: DUF58 domain-containing protein [Chitinophagaceae bacterium]
MSELLQPKVLLAIKHLQLAAKATVDSFMMGINKSNIKGQGLEFSQYRIYEPGDDLRWLDWKMFARSDRYYIRESEVDTSIYVRFVVDASASMKHEDNGFSKLEFAKLLTATLAYIAFAQGDAVGLYVCNESGIISLPTKNDLQHQKRFYHQLANIESAGKFTDAFTFEQIMLGSKKKQLTIFISDMYQQQQEISSAIHLLKTYKNELILLHVIGENELTFNYKNFDSVEDLETGEKMTIHEETTQQYIQQFQLFLQQTKETCMQQNIAYALINMQQTLEQSILFFLKNRHKIIR